MNNLSEEYLKVAANVTPTVIEAPKTLGSMKQNLNRFL